MAKSATNHEEFKLMRIRKRNDVQRMKHTLSRLNAKHVEGHTGCVEVPIRSLDDQMHHVPLEPEVPAQESPAPMRTSCAVFNAPVPKSVMADQAHQVLRSRSRQDLQCSAAQSHAT